MSTHIKKSQLCKYCDATFDTYQERKLHTASVHKDAAIHNQTNKTVIYAWTQANGRKECVCLVCDMIFERISDLRQHMTWHKSDLQSFNGINLASKDEIFSRFDNIDVNHSDMTRILQEKINKHSNELQKIYRITNQNGWEMSLSDSETECDEDLSQILKHVCGICNNRFNRLYKLMCHMRIDHPNSRDFEEFKCTLCLQYFPNSAIKEKHMKQDCGNKNKTIECSMCNNRFMWKSSLDDHIQIYHNADSKYMLSEKSSNSERDTSKRKSNEKRFSCDICKKMFSRTDNLRYVFINTKYIIFPSNKKYLYVCRVQK